MMRLNFYQKLALLLIVISISGYATAAERTQVIPLKKGWNAVYLEVDPKIENQDLSAYILGDQSSGSVPIEVIATYYPAVTSVEFISDPSEAEWKKATWNKWVRDDLPDAFLSNLFDLEAGRGYLIKVSKDYSWSITGTVEQLHTRWQPSSFNLTGFQVQANGPSFHQLFSGNSTAAALLGGPIYQLLNNQWEQVSLPDVQVGSGKAYWVFNNGQAGFQGGLSISIQGGKKVLNFSDVVDRQTLTLKNTSAAALSARLMLVDNQVPLSIKGFETGDGETEESYQTIYTPVTEMVTTVELAAGESKRITLAVRRSEITGTDEKTGLLKITAAQTYEEFWLPISAYGVNQE